MEVTGLVKNAVTEAPVARVKIVLAVGDRELAVLFSDREGCFEYMEEREYVSQTLKCRVEKEGFESQTVSREIVQDEIKLEVELVPEGVELSLFVHDEKNNSLQGVGFFLELRGEQIGDGRSDKNGNATILLSPDSEGRRIQLKAILAGFRDATGEIQLKKKTSYNITLKKQPKDKFQAIEQHPDYPELMRYTPSIRGRGWLIFMIGFGVLFIIGCFFMLFGMLSSNAPVFAFVPALMIVGVVAFMGSLLFRWRRLKAAPLQRVPAIVLEKRTEVSSGDYTHYYVTLEIRGGDRQEYNAEGKLYGLVSHDDMGVAYIKDRSLLGFRRLTVETSRE